LQCRRTDNISGLFTEAVDEHFWHYEGKKWLLLFRWLNPFLNLQGSLYTGVICNPFFLQMTFISTTTTTRYINTIHVIHNGLAVFSISLVDIFDLIGQQTKTHAN
jgi:hypothetical protein